MSPTAFSCLVPSELHSLIEGIFKAAAIKLSNGKLYTGFNHSMAIDSAEEDGASLTSICLCTYGFVDASGKFYDRREAAKLTNVGHGLLTSEEAFAAGG